MKDFLGNELAVGDEVVLIRPNYRQLVKAKINRFTKCFVILDYVDAKHRSLVDTFKQTPDQMIKVS